MKHILEEKVLFYGVIVRTFWMTLVKPHNNKPTRPSTGY